MFNKFFKLNFSRLAAILIFALTISLVGCSEESTISEPQQDDLGMVLLGKGGNGRRNNQDADNQEGKYPQSSSKTYAFKASWNKYQGGNIQLANGSTFHVVRGGLTAPPESQWGEEVTITMLSEKDVDKNELIFTFAPSGCQFDPPAEVWLDWSDLAVHKVKLFLIDEDDEYIEQKPYNIDNQGKRLSLYIDHFSRYAIAF